MRFCNIYTRDGRALTNAVLGGLAQEDNLLDAVQNAKFEPPYTYSAFMEQFEGGAPDRASFQYNGTQKTLTYTPISGTDWQLTYLVRESAISERVNAVSEVTKNRFIVQAVLTAAAIGMMLTYIIDRAKRGDKS